MLTVRRGSLVVPAALGGLLLIAVALLALLLEGTVGLGAAGWAAGLGCGLLAGLAVPWGLVRCAHVPGPADAVTLTRLTLSCGVAALVAEAFSGQQATAVLVGLAASALALDAVDGWVARRTGTASRFGGVFDGEADAFLMLVLSLYVARSVGGWVLAIGAARYAFAAAGGLLPWLRGRLPFRYWRKVVTGTAGVALTTVAAGLLPGQVEVVALVVATGLLAESFGRDVLWLWLRREAGSAVSVTGALMVPVAPRRGRRGTGVVRSAPDPTAATTSGAR